MVCDNCGTETVTWRGPLSNLTHTECSRCGGINCQRAEARDDDPDDEADDEVDCGLGPDGQCALAGTEWCDWDCGRLA